MERHNDYHEDLKTFLGNNTCYHHRIMIKLFNVKPLSAYMYDNLLSIPWEI